MWVSQYTRLHPDSHPVIQTLILNLFLLINEKFVHKYVLIQILRTSSFRATDESVMSIIFADDTSLIVMGKKTDILDAKLSVNL
jgi:hypothetical protein